MDIATNNILIRAILRGSDYNVITAQSGIEALDRFKKEPWVERISTTATRTRFLTQKCINLSR